ncbi:MAG TPA: hypothetical protein VMV32_08790, partial [Ignavibacteriaceae bacterium]|nr:hypothetical protein [Ignavibacteriaceae bacterium]
MAFDDTQPTDNTKIRDLGVVIRPNFVAIETGDSSFEPEKVNLLNRTTATVPIDPVAIATSYIMYSKEDSSGDPQLYGIDPNSNIMQFTGIAPSLATNGYVFLPGNLLLQWFSFTVKNDDNNNFPIAFAASPYAITGSEVTNN